MITPDPQPSSVLTEPPTTPAVAAMRYFDESFRGSDPGDSQCENFQGLDVDDLVEYKETWRERARYGSGGTASYRNSETTGDKELRVEIEFRYSINESSSSGLGFGGPQWGTGNHAFDITVEEFDEGQWCVASVEYVDPTHDSPTAHIAHYLAHIDRSDTTAAIEAECSNASTEAERAALDELYIDIEEAGEDRAWNESGDTKHTNDGLLIPWTITSEQTDEPLMELEFYLYEDSPGYCIDRITIDH